MTPNELRQRFADFAVAVQGVAEPLFDKPSVRSNAEQLARASSSAASNHRAAGRARSHKEFTARIGDALSEADETVFWLEHLIACKSLRAASVESLLHEACELVAILTRSHETAKRKDVEDIEAKRRSVKRRSHGR